MSTADTACQPDEPCAATTPAQIAQVRALFLEYAQSLGVSLCFQGFDAELAGLPGAYAAPRGCLLLACAGETPLGCIGLRALAGDFAELKRLYVRPAARGTGLGRRLALAALDHARAAGYRRVRLDTLPAMREAARLYEALGFREIAPYYDNPLPGVRYLELALAAQGTHEGIRYSGRPPGVDGRPPEPQEERTPTMSIAQRLEQLGITLPAAGAPVAAYVMAVQTGKLVFVSGHVAKKDGKPWVGQLGRDMSTAEGKEAARSVAIALLATLQAELGSLDRVKRIVKVMSLVNSTGDYTEQHLVTNGCSELLAEVFGDAGKHARSAFGVAQIPTGACVEIELIAEVD